MSNQLLKIQQNYPQPICSILEQHNFSVPLYQRDYTWKTDNWDELFNDIIQENNIYLGTIFLKVDDLNYANHGIADIIDGQQRLTTISILLNALRLAYLKKKESKLQPRTKHKYDKDIHDIRHFLFDNGSVRLSLYKDPKKVINTGETYRETLLLVNMPASIKKMDTEINKLVEKKKTITKKKKSIIGEIKNLKKKKKKDRTKKDQKKLDEKEKEKETLNNESTRITTQSKKLKKERENLKNDLEKKSDSEINIIDCNEFFFDRIKELDNKEFNNLFRKIKENISVFCMLTNDANSVYDYFRTLNSSGVPLTIAEILKNDLFKNVDKKDIDEVISDFETIKKSIHDAVKGDVENFLLYNINSRLDLVTICKKLKKPYPITKKNMLLAYNEILKNDGAKKLIKSFQENIEEYKEINAPSSIKSHMASEKFYYYNALKAFNISKPISPLLLSKRIYSMDNHLKNVKLLTYICLKQSLKPYGDPKDLQKYMNTAHKLFSNKEDYLNIKKELGKETKNFFETDFKNGETILAEQNLSNTKSKALVALIDRYGYKKMSGQLKNYGDLSLEHIMPQNQSEEWKKPQLYKIDPLACNDDKVYKKWIKQIGNHCIITTIDNSKIKDKSFATKKEKYEEYHEDLINDITKESSWTLTKIRDRNKIIYKRFKKII